MARARTLASAVLAIPRRQDGEDRMDRSGKETFGVSRVGHALYNANKARDRDKDRAACEQS